MLTADTGPAHLCHRPGVSRGKWRLLEIRLDVTGQKDSRRGNTDTLILCTAVDLQGTSKFTVNMDFTNNVVGG